MAHTVDVSKAETSQHEVDTTSMKKTCCHYVRQTERLGILLHFRCLHRTVCVGVFRTNCLRNIQHIIVFAVEFVFADCSAARKTHTSYCILMLFISASHRIQSGHVLSLTPCRANNQRVPSLAIIPYLLRRGAINLAYRRARDAHQHVCNLCSSCCQFIFYLSARIRCVFCTFFF